MVFSLTAWSAARLRSMAALRSAIAFCSALIQMPMVGGRWEARKNERALERERRGARFRLRRQRLQQVRVRVCARVCACAHVCVCVCKRERERRATRGKRKDG